MTVKAHAAGVALLAHRPAAEGVGTFLAVLHALVVRRVVRAPILGADEAVPSFATSGCVRAIEELRWIGTRVVAEAVACWIPATPVITAVEAGLFALLRRGIPARAVNLTAA
jgi:hypothetical protein